MNSLSMIFPILSFIIVAFILKKCLKFNINFSLIAPPNEDVVTHTQPIPIIGGLAIFSISIPFLIFLSNHFDYSLKNYFIGIIPVMLLGFYKDKIQKPFSPIIQFMIQGLSSYFLYMQWETINAIEFQWLFIIVFIFIFNLLMNAFNFLDVMDGLAGSYSLVIFSVLSIAGILSNEYTIAIMSLIFIGSNLAFLLFNWHPAKLFLGDVGSFGLIYTLLFFFISVFPFEGINSLLGFFFIFFVPLFELLFTSFRRILLNKLPYYGDANHASLLMLNSGLESKKIITLVILTSILTSSIGLSLINY